MNRIIESSNHSVSDWSTSKSTCSVTKQSNLVIHRASLYLSCIRLVKKECAKKLTTICEELVQLLNNHAIVKAQTLESQVLYQKRRGDHYCYMAEFILDDARPEYVLNCADAYQTSTELSSQLEITHHPPSSGCNTKLLRLL